MSSLDDLKQDLRKLGTPMKAKSSAWFFKTGPGEYGEGDKFIGVTVPEQRKVAKRYRGLPIADVEKLLHSKEHEFRLTALLILTAHYRMARNEIERQRIVSKYLANTKWINNWDLVDASAPYILGAYLLHKPKDVLDKLVVSKQLWKRRIAIVSTFAFIRNGNARPTLKLAKVLLKDQQDLIHKAIGWMLREVGKRCGEDELKKFLDEHYQVMPRTMLRYAIEHFKPVDREKYMLRQSN